MTEKLKVYYISDVHNDYHQENALEKLGGDTNAVLVVAGDINSKGRSVRDLEAVADRWLAIVAITGNHDWWGLALHEEHKFKSSVDNVHVLLNECVIIKDVVFCGTTLWHEVKDPVDENTWKFYMNDAKKIRGHNWKKLRGFDIHSMFSDNVEFIEDCRRRFSDQKKVLITHHSLCSISVPDKWKPSPTSSYYYTEMPELLEGFLFHIHGHIHQECDYEVHGCNVVCNPKGYEDENKDYGVRIFEV